MSAHSTDLETWQDRDWDWDGDSVQSIMDLAVFVKDTIRDQAIESGWTLEGRRGLGMDD